MRIAIQRETLLCSNTKSIQVDRSRINTLIQVAQLPPLPQCASAGGFHTHPCAPCGRTGISREPAGHHLQTHPLKNTTATGHTCPAYKEQRKPPPELLQSTLCACALRAWYILKGDKSCQL